MGAKPAGTAGPTRGPRSADALRAGAGGFLLPDTGPAPAPPVAHWQLVFLGPVPPIFSLTTQDSGAGLTCGDKSASDHRESCPIPSWARGWLPGPSAWGGFPSPVVFTLRSPIKFPPICLSFLPGCQPWQKCCAHPCFAFIPAMRKALH